MIFELFELFEFWTLWTLNSLNFELFEYWTLWILNSLDFKLFEFWTHIFQIICFTNVSGKGELWRFEQQQRLCWCDPGLWGWLTGWSSQGDLGWKVLFHFISQSSSHQQLARGCRSVDAQLPHVPPVVLQSITIMCWAAWDRMWSTSWGKTATASPALLPALCLTLIIKRGTVWPQA